MAATLIDLKAFEEEAKKKKKQKAIDKLAQGSEARRSDRKAQVEQQINAQPVNIQVPTQQAPQQQSPIAQNLQMAQPAVQQAQQGNPLAAGIQGATAGATIGGPIGAIIGGAAGVLGGVSASNVRKKEQLRQEEREKQLALAKLEESAGKSRQMALQNILSGFRASLL